MPVAKKKTMRAHPPTKSRGKRQPTGTTHFQLRPNQFGCGMGGGGGAGSISETEASWPYLKNERVSFTTRGGIPRLTLKMTGRCGFPRSSRQRLLCVGKGVSGDRHHRGVLLQFARNNFVQRVGGSVMIIKIKAAVLHWAECGNAGFFHRLDVSADVFGQVQSTGADFLQNLRDRLEYFFYLRISFQVEPDRMTRATIGFVNSKMIGKLTGVILLVLLRSPAAVLFVHPRNHADGSFRFEVKLLNQVCRFHRHRDACAIIDC